MQPIELNIRYAEKILVPDEAFPKECQDGVLLKTSEGVVCMAHFLSSWNNNSRRYDDELDGLCHRQWDCTFELVRNIWQGRLVSVGDIWHYIELKKV